MGQEQLQIEVLFKYLPVGIAILDSKDMSIHYLNDYLSTQVALHWNVQAIIGKRIEEFLSPGMHREVQASLQKAIVTGEEITYKELPYEGFEQSRGRTYWRISIKKQRELAHLRNALLITIEDVTEGVRSRLQVEAIQYVSLAIVGAYTLPIVLDRILQVLSELIGANASAVLLIAHSISDYDALRNSAARATHRMTIAAQKGIHSSSRDWHPLLDEHILFSWVEQQRNTQIINDSTLFAQINLPYIDEGGDPRRPTAVASVPIFEPHFLASHNVDALHTFVEGTEEHKAVFGSIEVYYPCTRNFTAPDIDLLERLALQAGLAIQNARLFRKLKTLVRAEQRSARQHKYIMQAMREGVIIADPRWRIAEANQTIYTLLGWDDKVIGLPITEAFKLSTATFASSIVYTDGLIPEFERRAQEGIVSECKIVGADQKGYIIRTTYTPIQDEIGDTFAFILVFQDVTEQVEARKRIEGEVIERTRELAQRNMALQLAKAAQETEHARLELLLERLPSGVILVSADNNTVITINQHAILLLQRMRVFAESSRPNTLVLAGTNAAHLLNSITTYDATGKPLPYENHPLNLALKYGKANEAELRMQEGDERTIYIFASAAPLLAANGVVSSAVLVYSEITAIKALEQAREDFFTTMAHELKTPLANVRAQLTALLEKDVQWSYQEQYAALQTADEQVKRLIEAVNRSLEASRIEAGALQLNLEPVLLPELFEDLEERLAALIASSQRHLRIVYTEELPAVEADYELIISVLTNLLSNAFRYAPESDSVLLEATVVYGPQGVAHQDTTGVMLRVSDKGPGLSEEQQKLLFTRFSKLSTANRGRGSAATNTTTGLGLYISRGIVEAHGSKLTLVSRPGQGASFSFTLPTVSRTDRI